MFFLLWCHYYLSRLKIYIIPCWSHSISQPSDKSRVVQFQTILPPLCSSSRKTNSFIWITIPRTRIYICLFVKFASLKEHNSQLHPRAQWVAISSREQAAELSLCGAPRTRSCSLGFGMNSCRCHGRVPQLRLGHQPNTSTGAGHRAANSSAHTAEQTSRWGEHTRAGLLQELSAKESSRWPCLLHRGCPWFHTPLWVPHQLPGEPGEQAAATESFCPVQHFTVRTSIQLKNQSSLSNSITQRTWLVHRKYSVSKISVLLSLGGLNPPPWFPQYLFPFKGKNQWAQVVSYCVAADRLLEQQSSRHQELSLRQGCLVFFC